MPGVPYEARIRIDTLFSRFTRQSRCFCTKYRYLFGIGSVPAWILLSIGSKRKSMVSNITSERREESLLLKPVQQFGPLLLSSWSKSVIFLSFWKSYNRQWLKHCTSLWICPPQCETWRSYCNYVFFSVGTNKLVRIDGRWMKLETGKTWIKTYWRLQKTREWVQLPAGQQTWTRAMLQ